MNVLVVSGDRNQPRLSIKELPKPMPGAGEVLIRIVAAGVMPSELGWPSTWTTRSGAARVDTVPSHEFSGRVQALGSNVPHLQVGDEVFGMNDWYSDGAMAEYCIAPAAGLAFKPRTLSHSESAAVPISALTAFQALFEHARVAANERVLVLGAAGSVGSFVVQLAAQHGCSVIGVASASDFAFVQGLGAAQVVDYQLDAFKGALAPVDVIVDTVGGELFRRAQAVCKPDGRLVTVASSSENSADERQAEIFFIVKPSHAQLSEMAAMFDLGRLRAFVKRAVTLSEAAEEYLVPTKGKAYGKTVAQVVAT
ncbi:MAG: NADP-dependent oxidoreductase [Rhodospirillales bacterium]|nr:NADP-dependent oxidoreductase [Acetobacter sp.]